MYHSHVKHKTDKKFRRKKQLVSQNPFSNVLSGRANELRKGIIILIGFDISLFETMLPSERLLDYVIFYGNVCQFFHFTSWEDSSSCATCCQLHSLFFSHLELFMMSRHWKMISIFTVINFMIKVKRGWFMRERRKPMVIHESKRNETKRNVESMMSFSTIIFPMKSQHFLFPKYLKKNLERTPFSTLWASHFRKSQLPSLKSEIVPNFACFLTFETENGQTFSNLESQIWKILAAS